MLSNSGKEKTMKSILKKVCDPGRIYTYAGDGFLLKPGFISSYNNSYLLGSVAFKKPIVNTYDLPYVKEGQYREDSVSVPVNVRGKVFDIDVKSNSDMVQVVQYEDDCSPVIVFEKDACGNKKILMLFDMDEKGRLVIVKHDDSKPWAHVARCTIIDNNDHTNHIITWFHPTDIMENIIPIDYYKAYVKEEADFDDPLKFIWKSEYYLSDITIDDEFCKDDKVKNQMAIKYIGEGFTHYIFKSPIYIKRGRICLSTMDSITEGETGLIEIMYQEGKNENFEVVYSYMDNNTV